MKRFAIFILTVICFLSADADFRSTDDPGSVMSENSFQHLLAKFAKNTFPYETGKVKPARLTNTDSTYIKNSIRPKSLVSVTDTSVMVWDDADDEGKVRADFPELIGAGAVIDLGNGLLLLEIVDMFELKGETESNKQGIFPKTIFLGVYDKKGKLLSCLVSNLILANEHGSLNRWSCVINSPNEIIIKEYGSRKEEKDNYSFTATFKITPQGKLVKIKSVKGGK